LGRRDSEKRTQAMATSTQWPSVPPSSIARRRPLPPATRRRRPAGQVRGVGLARGPRRPRRDTAGQPLLQLLQLLGGEGRQWRSVGHKGHQQTPPPPNWPSLKKTVHPTPPLRPNGEEQWSAGQRTWLANSLTSAIVMDRKRLKTAEGEPSRGAESPRSLPQRVTKAVPSRRRSSVSAMESPTCGRRPEAGGGSTAAPNRSRGLALNQLTGDDLGSKW